MWGFFGALLGIGASLFSKPKPQQPIPQPLPPPPPPPPPPAPPPQVVVIEKQTSTVDLGKLVTDSKAAGFNPLTVLRNGGLAGYQVTDVPFLTTNPRFVDWEAKNQSVRDDYNYSVNAQTLSWQNATAQQEYKSAKREWVGGLISGVGSAMSAYSGYASQKGANYRQGLENQLLLSEIERNHASTWSQVFQPNAVSGSSTSWVDPKGNSGLNPYGYETDIPKTTNPFPNYLKQAPWMPNAEVVEDSYGELVSWPYGIVRAGVDSGYTGYHYWSANRASELAAKTKLKNSTGGGGGW